MRGSRCSGARGGEGLQAKVLTEEINVGVSQKFAGSRGDYVPPKKKMGQNCRAR